MNPAALADSIIRNPKPIQTHDVGPNPTRYKDQLRKVLNRRGYRSPSIVLAVVPDTTQIVAMKAGE